jgi:drug/metabolite transporter (DMT)-like permease
MFMAYTCFYLALAAMPLVDTVALTFSSPLFLTALSILILGERASLRRWAAVATGFVGVLVMLRPGSSVFDPAALLAVAGALFYAVGGVQTRRLGGTESASAMAVYTTLFYLVAGGLVGLVAGQGLPAADAGLGGQPVHASLQFLLRPWGQPTAPDLGLMALLGVIAALGFYLLSQAYRVARVTAVAPFEYLAVPLSVALGYLVWGDVPTGYTIAGATLIVGSGLYVLRRESAHEAVGTRGADDQGRAESAPNET